MEVAPSADYLSFRLADDYLSILENKIKSAVYKFIESPPSSRLATFSFSADPARHESLSIILSMMSSKPAFFIKMLHTWKDHLFLIIFLHLLCPNNSVINYQ